MYLSPDLHDYQLWTFPESLSKNRQVACLRDHGVLIVGILCRSYTVEVASLGEAVDFLVVVVVIHQHPLLSQHVLTPLFVLHANELSLECAVLVMC
jgi:hypothetical protein